MRSTNSLRSRSVVTMVMKVTLSKTSATVDSRIGSRHALSSALACSGAIGAQSVACRTVPQRVH